jgi:TfoX-like protein
MAFDQDLAASVRTALAGASAIREVKMFGGIGFMLNGNLVAAVSKRGLLVRVGKDHRGNALAQQGARSAAIPTDWRRGSDHPRGKPTRQWRSSADTAHRVFHRGDFNLGGRFYGGYWQILLQKSVASFFGG